MHFVDRHREKIRQSPMSSRLLWACLLLVVLLVLTFGAALFLFASLHNTKKDISRSLQIQFSVFQNDMERYFDQLAVMGVNLSEDMSAEVDKELALRQMSFAQLNDSPEVLNALEEKMIEPLCRRLRQTGCSGAFVLLDATVNTRMEGAEHSRAGLYVQKSGADTPTVPLLLYRGSAEVGKTHSVMPHRKWRMEFQTDQFPDYDRWMTPGSAPLYQSYTLTERFELPGTSEEVQLFLLPLRGRDGTMYGLCGFEISESYFKQNFAQPTGFDRLSCLLAPAGDGLAADAALSGEGAVLALVVLNGQSAFRLVFVLLKTRIAAAAFQLIVAVQLDGRIVVTLHGDGGFARIDWAVTAAIPLLLAADVDLQVVEGDVHVALGGVDGDGVLIRLAGDDGVGVVLVDGLALCDLVRSFGVARFHGDVAVGDVPPGRIGRDAGAHHDARDDGGGYAPPECAFQSHSTSPFVLCIMQCRRCGSEALL